MSVPRSALAVALGSLWLAGGAAAEVELVGRAEKEVQAEFDQICRAMSETDGLFYGVGRSRLLQARLAEAPEDPIEAVGLRGLLGIEYLELGKTADAIGMFSEALALAQGSGLEPEKIRIVLWNLGLSHLQAAEDDNCIDHHAATSCILPFAESALHRRPAHTRRAGDAFLSYLAQEPDDILSAWLLNLARMLSDDFPDGVPARYRLPAGAFESEEPFPEWRDVAAELGVNALDLAGGAAMDDFDGDGLLDLVTSTWDPCGSLKAFRSDGAGGFEDVTRAWGLDRQLGGLNLMHADFDGDGRLDLLVLRGGWLADKGRIRNSLLHNRIDSEGGFADVTHAAGLAAPAYPTQAAGWADFDLDGDLDLYIGNEVAEIGGAFPSQLFENNGDGTFTDVAPELGLTNGAQAKGVAWGDFDDDGDPDLFVSNIGRNRLYRNDGEAGFTDVAAEVGLARLDRRTFASWFFDFDNDGDLDLFVADYNSSSTAVAAAYFDIPTIDGQPHLYRNDGGRFVDVSRAVGLERPLLPMGANYGDIDGDGWPDLYLGTGDPDFASVMPNVMYRNRGGRFADVTAAGGFGHIQKGHGVAFGDLDNDGDLDLFHQLGGFFPGDAYWNALFENPGPAGSWITLRLVGKRSNRYGLGARIEVRVSSAEGSRSIHVLAGSGGSFGGSSFQQEIGLGDAERIDELVIRWPRSPAAEAVQRFSGVELNRFYRVEESRDELIPLEPPRLELATAPGVRSAHPAGHRPSDAEDIPR